MPATQVCGSADTSNSELLTRTGVYLFMVLVRSCLQSGKSTRFAVANRTASALPYCLRWTTVTIHWAKPDTRSLCLAAQLSSSLKLTVDCVFRSLKIQYKHCHFWTTLQMKNMKIDLLCKPRASKLHGLSCWHVMHQVPIVLSTSSTIQPQCPSIILHNQYTTQYNTVKASWHYLPLGHTSQTKVDGDTALLAVQHLDNTVIRRVS